MTSVYDSGWFAAKSNKTTENPHPFGSEEWDYWQEGFNDGVSTWAQDKPIKQPIKESSDFLYGFIDPQGKWIPVEDHEKFAADQVGFKFYEEGVDENGVYNWRDKVIKQLLKLGWIRVNDTSFQVHQLTSKEKDTIFIFAAEHNLDKIYVDILDKNKLYNQPPEDLYESRLLFEQMSDQDLDYIADQTIQLKNKLSRQFPQIDRLYMWFRSSSIDIVVSSIKIKEGFRKQGIGSQIMKAINKFADQYGLSVSLDPDPQPGYKKKLIDFYKSHGFVRNKGRNTDFRISEPMYRKPQKSLKEMILK
jgi:GNAT superfamily N-acetyltransferase